MKPPSLLTSLSLLLAIASLTSPARATFNGDEFSPELAIGLGYAAISVGDSSSVLNSLSALKLDPVLSLSPLDGIPQLRFGISPSLSVVLEETDESLTFDDDTNTVEGTGDIPFILFQPEARLSWRQPLGSHHQLFLEPGIGFGGALGWLNLDSLNEFASAWEGRAFLYIGTKVSGGTAGVEFSYMRTGNMNFADNAHGAVNEFYVGIFGAF